MTKYFWKYWWTYIPEVLLPVIEKIELEYASIKKDKSFWLEFKSCLESYSWRPTPLYYAKNLSEYFNTAKIYIKREDLNHTWAHKINNVVGQVLLAKRMWKKRIITETWAGQNWLAVATCAAKFWIESVIYMWEIDIERQRPNVCWMELLWSKVVSVKTWTRTLKDAVNAAMRDWITNVDSTHYVIWSALWPSPFPSMVRDFQSVIGKELKKQIRKIEWKDPDYIFACVWWWSNSIWIFSSFLKNKNVNLIWVEAWWYDKWKIWQHASRFDWVWASDWIFQWYLSKVLQDDDGQVLPTHSVSAWLDYAWVWPEHAYLNEIKRVKYISANDKEAVDAFKLLASKEGIISALESAHAYAWAFRLIKKMKRSDIVVINQSGRGDKDIFIINSVLKPKNWNTFLEQELKRLNN